MIMLIFHVFKTYTHIIQQLIRLIEYSSLIENKILKAQFEFC